MNTPNRKRDQEPAPRVAIPGKQVLLAAAAVLVGSVTVAVAVVLLLGELDGGGEEVTSGPTTRGLTRTQSAMAPDTAVPLVELAGEPLRVAGESCRFQADQSGESITARCAGYPFVAASISTHDDIKPERLACKREAAVDESPQPYVWGCFSSSVAVQVSSEGFDRATAVQHYRSARRAATAGAERKATR